MKINKVKQLYHGTDRYFESFDFRYAKRFKDFGKGFYLTSDFNQAQKWAQSKARRKNKTYIYRYDMAALTDSSWKILELLQYNKMWMDFICKSRIDGYESDHDIIYDRIADNKYPAIAETLLKYYTKEISADAAISKIQWNGPYADQYCFKSARSLSLLKNRVILVQYKDSAGRWRQQKYEEGDFHETKKNAAADLDVF